MRAVLKDKARLYPGDAIDQVVLLLGLYLTDQQRTSQNIYRNTCIDFQLRINMFDVRSTESGHIELRSDPESRLRRCPHQHRCLQSHK